MSDPQQNVEGSREEQRRAEESRGEQKESTKRAEREYKKRSPLFKLHAVYLKYIK